MAGLTSGRADKRRADKRQFTVVPLLLPEMAAFSYCYIRKVASRSHLSAFTNDHKIEFGKGKSPGNEVELTLHGFW